MYHGRRNGLDEIVHTFIPLGLDRVGTLPEWIIGVWAPYGFRASFLLPIIVIYLGISLIYSEISPYLVFRSGVYDCLAHIITLVRSSRSRFTNCSIYSDQSSWWISTCTPSGNWTPFRSSTETFSGATNLPIISRPRLDRYSINIRSSMYRRKALHRDEQGLLRGSLLREFVFGPVFMSQRGISKEV